jgi:small-conductance mechanosensitive channel
MRSRVEEAFAKFWDSVLARSPEILVGLILLIVFILLGYMARRLIRNRLIRRVNDPLLVNFIGRIVFLLITLIGIILFLGQVGLTEAAGGMLAGAGVGALILGFAFKDIGENFIAGFLLAVSRPFGIGDIIQIDTFTGTVKELKFRNTRIRTLDGRDIFVPNATMVKNPLTNFTRDGLMRHDFTIGLDYEDSMAEAIKSIINELSGLANIVKTPDLMPFVTIKQFGVSTIDLQVFFWINTVDFLGQVTVLKSQVMHEVLKRLKRDGFNMPADIVELKIYQEGKPIPVHLQQDSPKKNIPPKPSSE